MLRFPKITYFLPILCSFIPMLHCQAASISGRVSPVVKGAYVRVDGEYRGQAGIADVKKDGSFKIDNLPPGTYDVEVVADGYVIDRSIKELKLETGTVSKGHFIKLKRAGRVAGRVFPPDADVFFEAYKEKHDPIDGRSYEGKYSLENIAPGKWKVFTRAEGYADAGFVVTVSEGKVTRHNVTLEREASISGKITPYPVECVILAKHRASKSIRGDTAIEKDGTYKITGLPSGIYDLVIIAKGYERVIGIGPLPEPDVLASTDRDAIVKMFGKLDAAFADKDLDGVFRVHPKTL